jgi:hypothetical protein
LRRVPGVYAHFLTVESRSAAEPDPRAKFMPPGPERDAAIAYVKTPAGRRAKCVSDIHALEANIPVRVPFWMFGGRGFPNGGDSWADRSQVAAYWLHPDDTLLLA